MISFFMLHQESTTFKILDKIYTTDFFYFYILTEQKCKLFIVRRLCVI
jgi:hypothetical protein